MHYAPSRSLAKPLDSAGHATLIRVITLHTTTLGLALSHRALTAPLLSKSPNWTITLPRANRCSSLVTSTPNGLSHGESPTSSPTSTRSVSPAQVRTSQHLPAFHPNLNKPTIRMSFESNNLSAMDTDQQLIHQANSHPPSVQGESFFIKCRKPCLKFKCVLETEKSALNNDPHCP